MTSRDSLCGPVATDCVARWATKYAPLVRFERDEQHFPADPACFRKDSRFRKSRAGAKDQGWNDEQQEWIASDDNDDAFYGAEWQVIVDQSLQHLRTASGDVYGACNHRSCLACQEAGTKAFQPWASRNVRPWDRESVYCLRRRRAAGPTTAVRPCHPSSEGLFLERNKDLSVRNSGGRPNAGRLSAPVFVDADYNVAYNLYRVLFWFFYELNGPYGFPERWVPHVHQGDWEHISLVVPRDHLEEGREPSHVYFAQHKTGVVTRFKDLACSDHHPIVFVDRKGHPTRPHPHGREKSLYAYEWRTWEDLRLIVSQDWRDFPGAWGAVGKTATTTGPLGPLYKRRKDKVRLRMGHDGVLYLKQPVKARRRR